MSQGIGGSDAATELAGLQAMPNRPPPIAAVEHAARLERARSLTAALGAKALLIGAGASLRYFTGVPWVASERLVALVLPVKGRPVMICPAFEQGSLRADLSLDVDLRLWEEDESPAALVGEALAGAGTLALDPDLPVGLYHALRREAPSLAIIDGAPVIQACRSRKSPAELALLTYAKQLTLEVQRRAALILASGIDSGEVKRFIDQAHRAAGAESGSTFCAVQFGRATAYPHGLPGEQKLREGDVVLIDTGCRIDGYQSDITRTYVYGTPSEEQRRVWEVEHEAQAAAFAALQPGLPCEEIDLAARKVLERHGFGPGYTLPGLPHRTGHGVGLQIHEGPYLVRGDRTELAPGMCFSNEPMIVLPDRFGIRLEDHMYVTETGAAWFTEPSPSIDRPFA